ncbi:hypothetical protein GCM10023195_07240 [Actinoallomurus liliacearum]|uniref:HTH cro/C1-type domain-containing protein n=1 Tax=Actinoallomurus liliacearum TaxID=1080073 RepID=A0ABP8TE70_9ACTN
MLSKVERGEKSPTIGVASRIAHALDASLSDLIGAPAAAESGVAIVMRENDRPVFRDPETGFERHMVRIHHGHLAQDLIGRSLRAWTKPAKRSFATGPRRPRRVRSIGRRWWRPG